MKVLMASDYPRSLPEIKGGTWAAAHNLVEALIRHTDVSVLAVSFRTDLTRSEYLVRHDGRLEIRQFPIGPYRGLINYWGQRRIFRRLLKEWRPDVVHAQSEGLYASLATSSGIPNVYTIHGIRLKELEMDRRSLGLARYYLRAREVRAHHKKATNIIAINQYTREAISDLHSARVWTIPNAVRQDLFELGRSRRSRASCNVLLIGGVRGRKDIMTAVAAMKELRDNGVSAKLDIVGRNDDAYLASVETYLRINSLLDAVTIHGLVDDDELKMRYETADILLLTSLEESSPICIVEAMAAGLPIVSTNVGGIAEMVGKNAILCRPGDVQGISSALSTILLDQSERKRMGELSREIASSNWSDEAVAMTTYGVYKEMVSGG